MLDRRWPGPRRQRSKLFRDSSVAELSFGKAATRVRFPVLDPDYAAVAQWWMCGFEALSGPRFGVHHISHVG